VYRRPGRAARSLLVVYDAASTRQFGDSTVRADIFALSSRRLGVMSGH
jgi:hypothetical protein